MDPPETAHVRLFLLPKGKIATAHKRGTADARVAAGGTLIRVDGVVCLPPLLSPASLRPAVGQTPVHPLARDGVRLWDRFFDALKAAAGERGYALPGRQSASDRLMRAVGEAQEEPVVSEALQTGCKTTGRRGACSDRQRGRCAARDLLCIVEGPAQRRPTRSQCVALCFSLQGAQRRQTVPVENANVIGRDNVDKRSAHSSLDRLDLLPSSAFCRRSLHSARAARAAIGPTILRSADDHAGDDTPNEGGLQHHAE